jgi:hypothetical protein
MRATCPAHLILFYLVTGIIFGEGRYNKRRRYVIVSSLANDTTRCQSPVDSLETAVVKTWDVMSRMAVRSACGEVSAVSVWWKVWDRRTLRGAEWSVWFLRYPVFVKYVLPWFFLFLFLDIPVERTFKPLSVCVCERNLEPLCRLSWNFIPGSSKFVRPFQFSLKPNYRNGQFTWRPTYSSACRLSSITVKLLLERKEHLRRKFQRKSKHFFHDVRFCSNSTAGNGRTRTVTRCLCFLTCLLVFCSSPYDRPPLGSNSSEQLGALTTVTSNPKWDKNCLSCTTESYILRDDSSLELYISCLVEKKRLREGAMTSLWTRQPCATTVELGYNVMKGPKYFVSL